MRFASYTDIGGRAYSEDSVLVRDEGRALCAVLADGLGGHGGGDQASAMVVRVVCDGWSAQATPHDLCALVEEANRAVVSLQTPTCHMKSTVVVLSVGEGPATYAYAGDSRLYAFAEGALVWQTRDHSASQIAAYLGQINEDQIRFHEDRSTLYKVVGQQENVKPEAGTLELSPAPDAFLLCSDGFWEYVLESEMAQSLRVASSPAAWLDAMRAIHKGRAPADCDNNSACVVWTHD